MTTNKISRFALMVVLAMILSYLETLIPLPFFVPGMKLGLANIITMIALYKMGVPDAATISLTRIVLSTALFGNFIGLAYSIAGGVLSLALMVCLKRIGRFSLTGVGIAGGVGHNLAQIGVAIVLLRTDGLIYYLPVLLITGTVTGYLTGTFGGLILKKLDKIPFV
ncbi:MAG: Gx transporter family protein [Actinomycetes bacterium]|jgi:heptaprenyl diphosphate synthase|nr:Gx transporter family protein [Actinomycetes bacterium]